MVDRSFSKVVCNLAVEEALDVGRRKSFTNVWISSAVEHADARPKPSRTFVSLQQKRFGRLPWNGHSDPLSTSMHRCSDN